MRRVRRTSEKRTPGRTPKTKSKNAGNRTRADLQVGRINQKLRTRDALVQVAAEFVRHGEDFSVADVADRARVSRPTAYRYFATPELLRAQATLFAAGRIETSALDKILHGSGSPEEKLDALILGSDRMIAAHEIEFRSLLRLSLEAGNTGAPNLPRRPQFRRTWLISVLDELKSELGQARSERLVAVLSLMCGIESFVVLHDILQMTPQQATDAKRWAARLLLHAALHEAAATGAAQSRRDKSLARRSK
jgi:AcrR family transcriptional regulator